MKYVENLQQRGLVLVSLYEIIIDNLSTFNQYFIE